MQIYDISTICLPGLIKVRNQLALVGFQLVLVGVGGLVQRISWKCVFCGKYVKYEYGLNLICFFLNDSLCRQAPPNATVQQIRTQTTQGQRGTTTVPSKPNTARTGDKQTAKKARDQQALAMQSRAQPQSKPHNSGARHRTQTHKRHTRTRPTQDPCCCSLSFLNYITILKFTPPIYNWFDNAYVQIVCFIQLLMCFA